MFGILVSDRLTPDSCVILYPVFLCGSVSLVFVFSTCFSLLIVLFLFCDSSLNPQRDNDHVNEEQLGIYLNEMEGSGHGNCVDPEAIEERGVETGSDFKIKHRHTDLTGDHECKRLTGSEAQNKLIHYYEHNKLN